MRVNTGDCMRISLIAALSLNHVIGKNNQLPWHMPNDLAHFKELTVGKPVIMGRKTFESIGKPLPKRRNIIITRDKAFTVKGAEVVHSLEEALQKTQNEVEVQIIGGTEIYTQALPFATHMDLTIIDTEIEGDTYFPQWNKTEWREITREDFTKDDEHPYDYHFITYERIQKIK